MAFKLDQSKTFKSPVTFSVLDENGKPVDIEFTAVFKRHDRQQIDDLFASKKPVPDNATSDEQRDLEVENALVYLAGWEDNAFINGTTFNAANVKELFGLLPRLRAYP